MTDVERNLEVVKGAYDAFGRGDVAGVLAALHEDVDWQPLLGAGAHVPMAGRRSGRTGASEFFRLLDQHHRFDTFEPREFIASGDRVIVLGAYSGGPKQGAGTFTSEWAMAFKLRDGKIVEFKEFTDSAAINKAFE